MHAGIQVFWLHVLVDGPVALMSYGRAACVAAAPWMGCLVIVAAACHQGNSAPCATDCANYIQANYFICVYYSK